LAVLAADGDELAGEVEVTVAVGGVRAVQHQHRVPVDGGVDALLDGVERVVL
jgi:hypothetical protein